jgi:hypothetical protein
MKKATHLTRLIDYLEKNKSITSKQSIDDLGNTRLSAYIFKLIELGYTISKSSKKVPTRFGTTTTVTKYTLVSKPINGIFNYDPVGEVTDIINSLKTK